MTSKADKVNKNGDALCERYGCRKHKNLEYFARGMFCKKHLQELACIRALLSQAKVERNVLAEILYRQHEIEFRKTPCPRHIDYLVHLQTTPPPKDVPIPPLNEKNKKTFISAKNAQ